VQVAVEVKFEAEIFALVRPSGRGDLVKRGLRKPELLIVDGGTGLEQALAALWGDVPTQRCTVHKHRNLLAHAPQRLQEEVSADYNDMIYATGN
jgi:transposase-like protein